MAIAKAKEGKLSASVTAKLLAATKDTFITVTPKKGIMDILLF